MTLQKDLKSKEKNATAQVLEANMGEFLYHWEWGSLSKSDFRSRHNIRKRLGNLTTLNNINKQSSNHKKVMQPKTPEVKSKDKHQTRENYLEPTSKKQCQSSILPVYEELLETKKKVTKPDRKMSKRQL